MTDDSTINNQQSIDPLANGSIPPRPPRPSPVRFDAIPSLLREIDRWVVWRFEWTVDAKTQTGRWGKVLKNARTLGNAKSNTRSTWFSLAVAKAAYENPAHGLDGVGFVFRLGDDTPPITGVDLDDCFLPDGAPKAWARTWLELSTYAEYSQSGRGVHLYLAGAKPGTGCVKTYTDPAGEKDGQIEIYDETRYFIVTGRAYNGIATVEPCPAFPALYQSVFTPAPMGARANGTGKKAAAGRKKKEGETSRPPSAAGPRWGTDDELLTSMFGSLHGAEIRALWDGTSGGNASDRDMALANHLAFWTGGDPDWMDALIRRSGRMRGKYDDIHYHNGETYGEHMIAEAIAFTTEVYQPSRRSAGPPPDPRATRKAPPPTYTFGELRKLDVKGSPLWIVAVTRTNPPAPPSDAAPVARTDDVRVKTDDLRSFSRFQRAALEQINSQIRLAVPKGSKEQFVWDDRLDELLEDLTVLDAPDDASDAGRLLSTFWKWADQWKELRDDLESLLGRESGVEILLSRRVPGREGVVGPWRLFFPLARFRDHLSRIGDRTSGADLWAALASAGAEEHQPRIGEKRPRICWILAAADRVGLPQDDEESE